jgi:phthalate 4,5-cis-dihydrodiol dehydrogenase
MKQLALGVAGLGRAFSVMSPAFADPRIALVAAADPRPEARARFEAEYRGKAYAAVEDLCADPALDVVYIATPHELHAQHARLAAAQGKHLLVEKPMALTLKDCRAMIAAARKAGVQLIVGHSHSFDMPMLKTKRLIDSGVYGAVRMITAVNFTDFVYRPRRPEELASAVLNQAAHQVDVVRLLAGGAVKSVQATVGDWDRARPTSGAYSALLGFDNGVCASMVYSGYGHFDSDEFMGWFGEMGQRKDSQVYWSGRRALQSDELAQKAARNYGGAEFTPVDSKAHEHFGLVIVSCEKADLRPLPTGVMIYGDAERRLDPLLPPKIHRSEVIDELYGAVVEGRAPLHGGEWAMATLEVCLAIASRSSRRKPSPRARTSRS